MAQRIPKRCSSDSIWRTDEKLREPKDGQATTGILQFGKDRPGMYMSADYARSVSTAILTLLIGIAKPDYL